MLRKDIEDKFPFLSVVTYGGNEYVGIVCNQDNFITSMYVYSELQTDRHRDLFLEIGETWWWESNRMIPINIFLRKEMDKFRYCLVNMNSKDVKIVHGPTVNLKNLTLKRVKRRSVQLVKKPK
ncbi:MAG: hypothetical protein CBC91_06295 [Rickettsiales bacterium TMED131]|nr:MAG: hypothetical protein CBC91_06295 [Rickettsiales bacterium TMED131]